MVMIIHGAVAVGHVVCWTVCVHALLSMYLFDKLLVNVYFVPGSGHAKVIRYYL